MLRQLLDWLKRLDFRWRRWAFLNLIEPNGRGDLWERHLPTTCKICAYHRFSLERGYREKDAQPPVHCCVEQELQPRAMVLATDQVASLLDEVRRLRQQLEENE